MLFFSLLVIFRTVLINENRRKECDSLMPGVRVRDNEPFERALKRFTKACEKAGLMSDIKKHQQYEKPSERRKRKINAARRKMRKMQMMQR